MLPANVFKNANEAIIIYFLCIFWGVLGVWSRRWGEPFTLFDHDMMMHFISELAKGRGPPKWP